MPASKAGPDFRAFRVTSEWRYDVEVDNILPQQRGTLWARRSISALEIDDPCRHGIISINSNSNQFIIQIQMGREIEVPTKWPSKKLTVIEVERVMIPCRSTSSPQAACMVPCRSWSSVLSTIVLLYAIFFVCVCVPWVCCLIKSLSFLPPSNELPPFELLIAAGHSLSVPFNLGAISL